jgi:hypothetical protein
MSSTAESSQVHARIIEFIESSTEKIYMIIGAEDRGTLASFFIPLVSRDGLWSGMPATRGLV